MRVTINIDSIIHKQLKIITAEKGDNLNNIVDEMGLDFCKKNDKIVNIADNKDK